MTLGRQTDAEPTECELQVAQIVGRRLDTRPRLAQIQRFRRRCHGDQLGTEWCAACIPDLAFEELRNRRVAPAASFGGGSPILGL